MIILFTPYPRRDLKSCSKSCLFLFLWWSLKTGHISTWSIKLQDYDTDIHALSETLLKKLTNAKHFSGKRKNLMRALSCSVTAADYSKYPEDTLDGSTLQMQHSKIQHLIRYIIKFKIFETTCESIWTDILCSWILSWTHQVYGSAHHLARCQHRNKSTSVLDKTPTCPWHNWISLIIFHILMWKKWTKGHCYIPV